jgi:hypothetical protein
MREISNNKHRMSKLYELCVFIETLIVAYVVKTMPFTEKNVNHKIPQILTCVYDDDDDDDDDDDGNDDDDDDDGDDDDDDDNNNNQIKY